MPTNPPQHADNFRSQLGYLLLMRTITLLLLVILSLLPPSWLGIAPEAPYLGWVLLAAAVCWGVSLCLHWFSRDAQGLFSSRNWLLIQLAIEVLILYAWLNFSGGATNAFVSLLLLPVALAAITLTPGALASIALASVAAYSHLLWQMPTDHAHHAMGSQMSSHFLGMWVNFIMSVAILTLLVSAMARHIRIRDQRLAKLREEQLRQENLLALGTASTQVAHQIATPMATLQLLQEELQDHYPAETLVQEMVRPLQHCRQSLARLRRVAQELQQQQSGTIRIARLLSQISEQTQLAYPELTLKIEGAVPCLSVRDDAALLPALLNLVYNAARASLQAQSSHVTLQVQQTETVCRLNIRDFGQGIDEQRLATLGQAPVTSQHGMGVSLLLSHATLERLQGKLILENHPDKGAVAVVELPLAASKQDEYGSE